ncbi:hypothetical protein F8388_026409 [Cannabis sativa]|uniref:Transposase MuDR plant domain-containing protein n=1 Tax=Cannabis sativa TaxID=3483 RepID=A0A7J6EVJ8_CANSA|nr:hypothetical protein F8388_026409 [Cannabis sativa]
MARSFQYRFPFGFLYKPYGKHLNIGFMVVNNASIQLMLEDLTARNNAKANVYLVLPDPQLALQWEEDAEAEPLGCKDTAKESDAYKEPDEPNCPDAVVTGFKEPLEETPRAKRLRIRRMRKAQPQTQAPDAIHDTLPETQLETLPQTWPDFDTDQLSQPQTETPASEIPVVNDDGNDWLDSRDELNSVHSNDEDGDHTSKLEFNPKTKNDDFKFELSMEFGSIKILRAALKEHFIHTDREYILIHNDKCKFRAKCNVEGCPWMIYAHVQPDGMTFKITTISEIGH